MMADSWDKMKLAVRRAAERELALSMRHGTDCQIVGPFFDVRAEGTYLGWCSPSQKDELQKLYDDTPSLLRPVVDRAIQRRVDHGDSVKNGIAFALTRCRQLEAEIHFAETTDVTQRLGALRAHLELLYETHLTSEAAMPQHECKQASDGCCITCGVSMTNACDTCQCVGYHKTGCAVVQGWR